MIPGWGPELQILSVVPFDFMIIVQSQNPPLSKWLCLWFSWRLIAPHKHLRRSGWHMVNFQLKNGLLSPKVSAFTRYSQPTRGQEMAFKVDVLCGEWHIYLFIYIWHITTTENGNVLYSTSKIFFSGYTLWDTVRQIKYHIEKYCDYVNFSCTYYTRIRLIHT